MTAVDRWSRPLRVVQFLLREADARVEAPERLVAAAADWGANAILVNAAGFSAWYPTRLAYHPRNPFLDDDFFGAVVEQACARSLKVFARVDISKVQPPVAREHPDWLRRTPDRSVSTEWEMPETCFTGGYWQSANREIVDELLGAYAVDGVFYNMYRVAHCHCERCQSALREAGVAAGVPVRADPADPAWRAYERWRRAALVAYTERLREAVHARRPDAALMVYHHQKEGWDVTGIARASDLVSVTASSPLAVNPLSPQPAWVGWAGAEAALARGLKPDRPGVVVTTTSALFASRRAAQPAARLQASVLQVAFQRGAVCPAIPGGLQQEDPRSLPAVEGTLGWLARHESLFEGLESPARVALLASRDTLDLCPLPGEGTLSRQEEWGLSLALDRARVPYDLVPIDRAGGADLSRYRVALLPDVACLSDADARLIDAWVEAGGTLLATGLAGAFDEGGEARERSPLRCLGRPRLVSTLEVAGGYLAVGSTALRDALGGAGIVGVERHAFVLEGDPETPADEQDLHLLGPVRNNTPEFALVPEERGLPGLLGWRFGVGRAWHLPWRPGVLVSQHGLPDPARVIAWLLGRALPETPFQLAGLPNAVEARCWLQPATHRAVVFLLNTAALQTTPLTEVTRLGALDHVELRLTPSLGARRIRSLTRDRDIPFQVAGNVIMFSLHDSLDAFEALQIDLEIDPAIQGRDA